MQATTTQAAPRPAHVRPYRIIITDDHALVREGLKRIFESEGDMEVVAEASSGEGLLEILRNVSCDLVILDLSMPGQGGIRTLEILDSQYPEIRTLILTMYDEPGYLQKAMDAHADGYILKDEKYETLIDAVRLIRDGEQVYTDRIQACIPGGGDGHSSLLQKSALPRHSAVRLLTRRELQILKLIAQGKMNKEIADDLGISKRTVEFHRANIMEKLNLRNLTELVRFAVAEGLA
jgi:DNA-binding NarL/FixJ family response regulator